MQEHGRADADRDALHGGDDRLFAACERMQEGDRLIAEPAAGLRRLLEILQIVAGAERARHARDQQAADAALEIGVGDASAPSRNTFRH